MFIAIIFGALVSSLIQGTIDQPDCKKYDHKPEACRVSKLLEKGAQKK